MFKEERTESMFDWGMIGDIGEGRPNLGPMVDVAVYRLMQFTLRDTLIQEVGVEAADRVFFRAGELAGRQVSEVLVTEKKDFHAFVEEVQGLLAKLKIGILRVEEADLDTLHLVLTVAEDLDCSGLPVCDEQICTYDEGFISGLLTAFTGLTFEVREVDCWCSGDRVCRFTAKPA